MNDSEVSSPAHSAEKKRKHLSIKARDLPVGVSPVRGKSLAMKLAEKRQRVLSRDSENLGKKSTDTEQL